MVEVLVAVFVLAAVAVGLVVVMGGSLRLVGGSRHRTVAANLAGQEMDTVRATAFADLPLGQVVRTEAVGAPPVPYTITREAEWVTRDASGGACDAPPGERPAYLRVDVTVTWPNMGGVQPVRAHTLLTPPVGAFDPNSGHIAVKVMDRDGLPEGGILIVLAGPQGSSQVTNSDGCAFFAFLPAGDYTVTASAPGYVDLQGVAEPSQPASVIVGSTASVQFQYDLAATLSLSLVGKDEGGPAPATVPVSLANTHLLPAGVRVVPGSGSPRVIGSLFPYADGYEVWAGDCSDADPAAYPGGVRTGVATEPGQTTDASVLMPEVRVTVRHYDPFFGQYVPVPDQPVDADHASEPSPGCTAGAHYAMGATDEEGVLLFALPWGTWTIAVAGQPAGSVLLDPSAPPADGDGQWPFDVVVDQ